MWVVTARVLLLVAAVAALVFIPFDPVVEVAGAVVAGLVLEVVTGRRKPPPSDLEATPDDAGGPA